MQFSELKKDVENVHFLELRTDTENYFEAVISNDELKNLTEKLRNFFGPPLIGQSQKRALSSNVQETIKDFGGISEGQTLYFCNQDNLVSFAMLWPWSDGRRTTIKMNHQSSKPR